MADLNLPNTIDADTLAVAGEVQTNFEAVETFVETELIAADGTVSMTAPLNLVGSAPTAPTHAVSLQYVESKIPVGVMWEYGAASAPTGWALCDGAPKSSTDPDYEALFAVIGYTFGNPGSGNFNLPDFRQRSAIGYDPTGGDGFDLIGEQNGQADTELPQHHHDATTAWDDHEHTQWIRANAGARSDGVGSEIVTTAPIVQLSPEKTSTESHRHIFTTDDTGTNNPDKNYHPYLTVTKIIKL